MARDKELAAAKMREKQVAGTETTIPFFSCDGRRAMRYEGGECSKKKMMRSSSTRRWS